MKKLIAVLLLVCPLWALAEGETYDPAPDYSNNPAELQAGARLFVNYCLSCHSAQAMRYNRMRDIGLSDEEIKQNLLFANDKVGDLMKVAMRPEDAKKWFGVAPPDLSVMVRAKGADYIYALLRGFYRDPSRPTGFNNRAYPNTAMPPVLWELQGIQDPVYVETVNAETGAKERVIDHLKVVQAGKLDEADFDHAAGDLVAFLGFVSEPYHQERIQMGMWVLLFLALMILITWRLNAAYWKDIK